jgi:hypothetical protein
MKMRVYTFVITSCQILSRMSNVSDKSYRENQNTNFMFINIFPEIPLQAWSGPERSRKLRFPDFMTAAQDGGKVVSLTHQPPLPPEYAPGTHFC